MHICAAAPEKRFDWKLAKSAGRKRQIFLAGGLTPENAEEAIPRRGPSRLMYAAEWNRAPARKTLRGCVPWLRQCAR